jgi:AraC-like DNA-binding protein
MLHFTKVNASTCDWAPGHSPVFRKAKRCINETRMARCVSVNYSSRAFGWVADNLRYSPTIDSRAILRVRKVVSHIESNLSGTILVGALARIAGVSHSCLHRTFLSCFGLTPHVYVTVKRVEFAQVLMLTTNEPLSQISLACGMADQSHFTRIFRRLTGKTPGQWRTWKRRQRELRAVADLEIRRVRNGTSSQGRDVQCRPVGPDLPPL